MIGKVKWFDPQKGYGFIARPNDTDVFVHHQSIAGPGFRKLEPGDEVVFDLELREKGQCAVKVTVTKAAPVRPRPAPKSETPDPRRYSQHA